MAVQVFLKTGFQWREKFFELFWGQLFFIVRAIFHTFTSGEPAKYSITLAIAIYFRSILTLN